MFMASLGIETQVGGVSPNSFTNWAQVNSKRCCWPMARYRSSSARQVGACLCRTPPSATSPRRAFSHSAKSALAKAMTAWSNSGS